MPISALLVDDHLAVKEGYRLLLAQYDINVVAEADSGEQAFIEYQYHSPDIVLMDLSINGMNGLDCISRIILHYPNAKIIVLSMHDNFNFISRAIDNGAKGYVLKSNPSSIVIDAIHQTYHHSKTFLCPAIAKIVAMKHVSDRGGYPLEELTPREYSIFLLLVDGKTRSEISKILSLSAGTISNNKARIMQKLSADSLIDLLQIALKQDIIKLNQLD